MLHLVSIDEGAVRNEYDGQPSERLSLVPNATDELERCSKIGRARRFTVSRERKVFDRRKVPFSIALKCVQKPLELRSKPFEIDGGSSASGQTRNLAIDTTKVAGVVRIEIDPDGHSTRASRQDRVDVD
jgi:hypothetical protein